MANAWFQFWTNLNKWIWNQYLFFCFYFQFLALSYKYRNIHPVSITIILSHKTTQSTNVSYHHQYPLTVHVSFEQSDEMWEKKRNSFIIEFYFNQWNSMLQYANAIKIIMMKHIPQFLYSLLDTSVSNEKLNSFFSIYLWAQLLYIVE